MTAQATTGGTTQGGTSLGGQAAGNSAFAALVASLLGGDAMPATAQGMSALGLFAIGMQGAVETTEGVANDEAALEAALEQLAAWIGSLSAELQQKLAADPKVAEWMAMANAELEMSAGAESASTNVAVLPELATETEADEERKPLSELLDRLIRALDGETDQPFLAVVAKQATMVFAQAVVALEAVEAGSIPGAAVPGASKSTNGAEPVAKGSAGASSELASLLSKTNGTVDTTAESKSEAPNANARWSHLTAMQAKTALVRVSGAETTQSTIAVEVVAKSAESATNESNVSVTSNFADAVKSAQTEAAKGAEAAPRMPLAEAAEKLNDWVLKQSATGGNLKAETVLKLMPEHLGQVEVKLTMTNGQLTAAITTESAMAKEALESNLATLRSSLQSQGVTVERLVVSQQQPSGFQSGMFQEGRQQRQSTGRDGAREERGRKNEGAEDWAEALAVSAEQEAAALDNYGTSFRAEA
jgi:flagellar hook-length control protein FliK